MRHVLVLLIALPLLAHGRTATVQWSATAQPSGYTISGYYVYRSKNGGATNQVATVNKLYWNDSHIVSGNQYCYSVATRTKYNGTNQASQPSAPVCVTIP